MADSLLVIPIFISHRGCPHHCLFCNQYSITGESRPQPDDIGDTVTTWLTRSPGYAKVQVAFYGGSFTCLQFQEQVELLEQVQPFFSDGQVHSIRLSTRPDCITAEITTMLKEYGVETVELGVQSLDDKVLRKSLRGHTAADCFKAIEILKKGRIEQIGIQLLPGLPGETTRSFLNGVKKVIELCPAFVRIYPTVVVNGSGLERMYNNGEYASISLNRAIGLCRRAKELLGEAGIPVIRMGLQPSSSLEKDLVAGPFHPAFGELVTSRQWFRRIRKKLAALKDTDNLTVKVSPKDYSSVVGLKRTTITRFNQLGYGDRLTVVQDKELVRGSIEYVID